LSIFLGRRPALFLALPLFGPLLTSVGLSFAALRLLALTLTGGLVARS
jgi:hypothetical protein